MPDDVVARLEALQKVEEVTEETQVEKNLPKMELPIWFDGKQINEILLYQTILQQHEIKCINGILYDIDRSIPNDEMEKEILDIIEHYWTSGISAKVTAILSGFKMYTRSDPLPIKEDTISNKSQLLMNEMQEDDDNILSFLESTGYIGLEKGTHATSKDLYVAYCRWCNDNLDVPVSERSFARRFKERSADYGMTYDKNISVGNGRFCRGFRGVHVKVRTKDVNY